VTRAALLVVAVLGLGAADARAAFSTPAQLAAGGDGIAAHADTDASGTTTALITGAGGAPMLVERPRGGTWAAGVRLPGNPHGMAGPVLDAAGDGALGIAWRVDRPRRYGGIAVALRDPGGTLSEPITVAGDDAGGTRHPALAVDAAGDALLAYNTATRASHLSIRGQIAVAYRRRGGTFSTPLVVDRELSAAPAVAIAPDGSGIVAWVRGHRIHAVAIAADGSIGTAKAYDGAPGASSLVAAVGEDGAATVAWTSRHELGGRRGTGYAVDVLRRDAGHAFGSARTVASTRSFLRGVAIAMDEGERVTLAWSEQRFGPEITGAVATATARRGRPFAAARRLASHRGWDLSTPALAARDGRVALAWSFVAGRRRVGVQAAAGPAADPGPPQTLATTTLSRSFFFAPPSVAATLDAQATIFFAQPIDQGANAGLGWRLMSADGS
jgi:hypothetical protein